MTLNDYLTDDNTRIESNIKTVNDNILTKQRDLKFNENKRLRTEHYNEILYVFIFASFVIIAIVIGFRKLPFLPDSIAQILIIIIGSIAFIRIFILYKALQNRSHLNYNELNLAKPAISSPEEIKRKQALAKESGDLLGSTDIGGCKGAACCESAGVKWDITSGKCITGTADVDDTDDADAFTVERLKYNKSIAPPNYASEVNTYSKV
jgi:hypothetical protein